MKNKGLFLLMGFIVTISFLFSGCSKNDTTEPKETNVVNTLEEKTSTDTTKETSENNSETDKEAALNNDSEEVPDAIDDSNSDDASNETDPDPSPAENPDAEPVDDDPSVFLDVDYKPYFKTANKAGTLEQITYYSEVIGADRTALVYKPYNFPMNAKYPVILMIHGLGCDETQWTSMSACQALDHMIEEGIIKPCIAVFPSVVPAGGLTADSYSAENINAFVDFVDEWSEDLWPYLTEHYPLLDNREAHAVCGLSMGGMEALRLGFAYLDFFDYIGSFSAAPSLDLSELSVEGSELLPDLVLICTGDKDTTVGDNPYNYYQTIVNNGVDSIWYLHPGEAHSPAVWKLGLYNFLIRLDGSFKVK